MKPEAQRIAIAEACGWQDCKTASKIGRTITKTIVATNDVERAKGNVREKRGLPNWPYVTVPDYLNDLNAMHEAEKGLLKTKVKSYLRNLRACTGMDYFEEVTEFRYVTATAAQRAEAFLKTLNLWNEES